MDDKWLGKVITVVDGSPRKYIVTCITKGAKSYDLRNNIPYLYKFQSDTPLEFDGPTSVTINVWDHVFMSQFKENETALHHGAIRFGLHSIRTQRTINEFDLTVDTWSDFAKLPRLAGQELRLAILRFFYVVNMTWPELGISYCDLLDNFNNEKSDLNEWIRSLKQEECLVERGFEHYWHERNHVSTQGYTINPKLKNNIRAELFPPLPEINSIDPRDHKYFKLVETQSASQGKFAFVLMPFKGEEFPQTVFDEVFRPLVRDVLGIECVKVDNDKFKNFIENKIFSHIVKSELVIAGLSTENPNVIFELGMSLSFNKPLIPTYWKQYGKRRQGRLSFDYEHFDTIFYDDLDQLRSQLREALDALKPKLP